LRVILRNLYHVVKDKALQIAHQKGFVRVKDLTSDFCKATVEKHLATMVAENLLKKDEDKRTGKPVYYIQPSGVIYILVKEANERLTKYLNSLEEIGKIDFSELSTESLISFIEGFIYSSILSFLHNLTLINKMMKEDREVAKEGFISAISETMPNLEKEKIIEIFENLSAISENWRKIPAKIKGKLYREYPLLYQFALQLKNLRDKNLSDLENIFLNTHLSYINKVFANERFRKILDEAIRRPDFTEKISPVIVPFIRRIEGCLAQTQKIRYVPFETLKEVLEEIEKIRKSLAKLQRAEPS
jgi:hypothetical protein